MRAFLWALLAFDYLYAGTWAGVADGCGVTLEPIRSCPRVGAPTKVVTPTPLHI